MKFTKEMYLDISCSIFRHINYSILSVKITTGINYEQDFWILRKLSFIFLN